MGRLSVLSEVGQNWIYLSGTRLFGYIGLDRRASFHVDTRSPVPLKPIDVLCRCTCILHGK